jgi:hypothetical protein
VKDVTTSRLIKLKKTMKRILTVVGERQKIRKEYRERLEEEYIEQKKT